MKDFELNLSPVDWIELNRDGLDTHMFVGDDDGASSVTLSWVQAQQLYRWLKERLGE